MNTCAPGQFLLRQTYSRTLFADFFHQIFIKTSRFILITVVYALLLTLVLHTMVGVWIYDFWGVPKPNFFRARVVGQGKNLSAEKSVRPKFWGEAQAGGQKEEIAAKILFPGDNRFLPPVPVPVGTVCNQRRKAAAVSSSSDTLTIWRNQIEDSHHLPAITWICPRHLSFEVGLFSLLPDRKNASERKR